MKKTLLALFTLLTISLTVKAQYGEYVGGDISLLPAYEEHNSGYIDGNGKKIDDLLKWFKNECGWNAFRVRLFVDPKNTNYDGVIQNLEYVKKLGKRIKDAGAYFMLDFHYSDTWVDATHIQAPASWSDCTTADQKATRLATYTKETLQALKAAGATPDLVQVGNEIMYGFVGIKVAPYDGASGTDWTGYLKVLKAGCDAVREECPQAKIIIHTDRPCNAQYNKYYYSKLNDAGIDYDIIGLSYYPFWHGTLTSLKTALTNLKTEFPAKKVQIVETAYNFQYWPESGDYDTRSTWGNTVEGQYKFVKDLVNGLSTYDNVNGLFYWFPEEAGNGDDTSDWSKPTVLKTWLNRGFWYEDVTSTGHWPLKASDGMVHYLFKNFLGTAGINNVLSDYVAKPSAYSDAWFTPSGQRVAKPTKKGIYIHKGKKVVR